MYIGYKRLYYTLFVFICFFCALTLCCKNYEKFIVKDLSNAVIRFHVRANSDSVEDQKLKMKVKEKIIEFLNQHLDVKNKSTDDAISFLKANTEKITTIADEVIHQYGYDYPVTATLGQSDFPDRYYGDVKFPSGTYNSFIVEIGSGEGKNWWCVLYPPLCFVDASTGTLPEESKETLKESISTTEYEYVTGENNSPCNSETNDEHCIKTTNECDTEPKFQFKYFTFLNHLFE